MKKKKWLIINPPTGKYIREDRCQAPVDKIMATSLRPPLDLAYIAGVVKKFNHDCLIIDYPAEMKNWIDYKENIINYKPDYLVISTTYFTLEDDVEAADIIKSLDKKIITIIKGAPVIINGKKIIEKYSNIDIGVTHDYEMAFMEIAQGKDFKNIHGIIFRIKNKIIKTQKRRSICLDELPKPRRDLLKNELYKRPDTEEMQTTVMIGKGCNELCIYCIAPAVNGNRVRYRSIEKVIEEIIECNSIYNIKNFYFLADNFTFNKKWVINFCKSIIKYKLKIKWLCNSKINTIDSEVIYWMRKSGCYGISFGIETGDKNIVKKIRKKINLDDVKNVIKICNKNKIVTLVHFIIGFPWDDVKSVKTTVQFAKKIKATITEFNLLTPFPGTALWNIAKKNNLIFNELNYKNVDYSMPIMKTLNLNKKELVKLRTYAFRNIYFNIIYILKVLKHIKSFKQLFYCFIFFIKKIYNIILINQKS